MLVSHGGERRSGTQTIVCRERNGKHSSWDSSWRSDTGCGLWPRQPQGLPPCASLQTPELQTGFCIPSWMLFFFFFLHPNNFIFYLSLLQTFSDVLVYNSLCPVARLSWVTSFLVLTSNSYWELRKSYIISLGFVCVQSHSSLILCA